MHLIIMLLALTVLIGILGFGVRQYFSAAQVKHREGQRRILGQYKRW